MFSSPSPPPPPAAPPPPPNPAMYGSQIIKGKAGGQGTNPFNASVLGALPQNTANKTLLGQ